MLSTFVLLPPLAEKASPEPSALVRTLASLVPAAVDGLIRDVWVMGRQLSVELRMIAEDAGCGVIETQSFQAAALAAASRARSEALFVLYAGAAFEDKVIDEVGTYFSSPRPAVGPKALLLRQDVSGLLDRVLPRRARVVGVITPKAALAGGPPSFETLVRGLRPTRTLAARARMPG